MARRADADAAGGGTTPPDGIEAPLEVPAEQAPGGKGRPTPKRSQAEAANRTPLVGARSAKATSSRAREERRANFAKVQESYRTEDQKYLPLRDRGMPRRFVRDLVDGRRHPGQYFLPAALVILLLSAVPYDLARIASAIGMYTILGVILLDSFILFRTTKARVRERFGDKAAAENGLGMYAVSRALQMRRMRRPVPQVKHGQPPRP